MRIWRPGRVREPARTTPHGGPDQTPIQGGGLGRLAMVTALVCASLVVTEMLAGPEPTTALNLPTSPSWLPLGDALTGLSINEAFGAEVSLDADATVLAAGAPFSTAGGVDSGQVRVFAWDGTTWQPTATITGVAGEQLGTAVELSDDGDTLVVTAPQYAAASGRVQVYHWDGSSWSQRGNDIVGSVGDELGSIAVSSDGTTLVVGNALDATVATRAGSVVVYDWDGSHWVARSNPLRGGGPGDRFGARVALTPDAVTLAVSAIGATTSAINAGEVYVYDDVNGVWQARATPLEGVGREEWFGSSLAISDDGIVVAAGSRLADRTRVEGGVAEVHVWNGSAWTRRGATFAGAANLDQVGADLALSSDGATLAVTSAGVANGASALAGSGEVYDWNSGTSTWERRAWAIQGVGAFDLLTHVALSADGATVATARLGATSGSGVVEVFTTARVAPWGTGIVGEDLFDRSGGAVDVDADGDTVVVGAPGLAAGSLRPGRVDVYRRSSLGWVRLGAPIAGTLVDELFGAAVAIDAAGDTIVVGAPQQTGSSPVAGAVYVYDFDGMNWQVRGGAFEGTDLFQRYGEAVAIDASGTVIALGVPGYDAGATLDVGRVEVHSWNGAAWTARPAFDGVVASGELGSSVALDADGDVVAMGAPQMSPGARTMAGTATVSVWNGATWTSRPAIEGAGAGDRLGGSLALDADGDVLATGSPGYEIGVIIGPPAAISNKELELAAAPVVPAFGPDVGRVLVHGWSGATWTSVGQTLMGQVGGDKFGQRVDLDDTGALLVVGAPGRDVPVTGAGEVTVHRLSGALWQAVGEAIPGANVAAAAGAGLGMARDGRVIGIGAPGTEDAGLEKGQVQLHRIDRRATPPAPRPLGAVGAPGALDITWTRGTVDPSDPITTSTIEHSSDGGRTWTTSTWSSLDPTGTRITGLAEATDYRVRVADVNASGTGAWAVTAATTGRLAPVPPPPASIAGREVSVLSGADPFALAAAVSRATFPEGADVVYVSTAATFPDAITGGGARATAPVLLTRRDELPAATVAELERLSPTRLVIVGGENVVSPRVEAALDAVVTAEIFRLGGRDRYETAAAVARHRHPEGAEVVVVVSGTVHGDGAVAGPLAAAQNAPILLTGPRSVPAVTREALAALSPRRIVVIGGPRAISEEVMGLLGVTGAVVERIAGADRAGTAAAVAAALGVADVDEIVMVDADRVGDALTVGAAAIRWGTVALYVSGGCVTSATLEAIEVGNPRRLVLVTTEAGREATTGALERRCDTGG